MREWEAREEDEDEVEKEEKEQPLDKLLRGEGMHHQVAIEGRMMRWCGSMMEMRR